MSMGSRVIESKLGFVECALDEIAWEGLLVFFLRDGGLKESGEGEEMYQCYRKIVHVLGDSGQCFLNPIASLRRPPMT